MIKLIYILKKVLIKLMSHDKNYRMYSNFNYYNLRVLWKVHREVEF